MNWLMSIWQRMARGLGALCALAWVLLCSPVAAEMRSLDAIQLSGTLRICVAGSSAPFYRTNGESLAHAMGLKAEVIALKEWDEQFHNQEGVVVKEATYVAAPLESGRCDVFPNDLHVLDWRATKMDLVRLYTARKVVLTHRQDKSLKTVSDLQGKTVAVQKQTAYDTWILEQNASRFVGAPIKIEYMPTAQAVAAVAAHKADFTVIGAEAAFKWVRADLDNLDIRFTVDAPVAVAWGIHPKALRLREAIQKFFVENARVGSDLDRSWSKQYGISLMEYQLFDASQSAPIEGWRSWLWWLLPLGAVVLGAGLASAVWYGKLQQETSNRQWADQRVVLLAAQIEKNDQINAQIHAILLNVQRAGNDRQFAKALFEGMASLFALGKACMYRADIASATLNLAGSYASEGNVSPEPTVDFGRGLVGQCAVERQWIMLHDVPDDYGLISAGVVSVSPAAVALIPVMYDQLLVGVMELALLRPWKDSDKQLIERLLPAIATSLQAFKHAPLPAGDTP